MFNSPVTAFLELAKEANSYLSLCPKGTLSDRHFDRHFGGTPDKGPKTIIEHVQGTMQPSAVEMWLCNIESLVDAMKERGVQHAQKGQK